MICPEVAHRQQLVWLDLEKAIREAAEEFQRRELEEEKTAAPLCFVCYGPVERDQDRNGKPRAWFRVCQGCRAKGYVGSPCKGCGGPLKRTDQHGPKRGWRNYCGVCRIDVLDMDAMRQGGRKGSLIRWGRTKASGCARGDER